MSDYSAIYDATVSVQVSEEEARAAFDEHVDDHDWTTFEEDGELAAEVAAREKLNLLVTKAPDYDAQLDTSTCQGVWDA